MPLAGRALEVAAQIEIARGLTDNESIGDIICTRAGTLNALAVVRARALNSLSVANDALFFWTGRHAWAWAVTDAHGDRITSAACV